MTDLEGFLTLCLALSLLILLYQMVNRPRKIIMVWAKMCEVKMRKRDSRYPCDWRTVGVSQLEEKLLEERLEVDLANPDELTGELVDESIMTMILADKRDRICDHDGRGR